MRFEITAASTWRRKDKMIMRYPQIKDFNYKPGVDTEHEHRDPTIEINSLEELMKFKEAVHSSIILSREYDGPNVYREQIEIYDDYRE